MSIDLHSSLFLSMKGSEILGRGRKRTKAKLKSLVFSRSYIGLCGSEFRRHSNMHGLEREKGEPESITRESERIGVFSASFRVGDVAVGALCWILRQRAASQRRRAGQAACLKRVGQTRDLRRFSSISWT